MDARAAVAKVKEGPFEVGRVSIGEPRADEVLVKVTACGVCHTDLICRDQWYPVPLPSVFGHEGSGVIEAIGENVTKVAPGDRVAMSYNSCGLCGNCLSGNPGYCKQFFESNFSGARPDGSNAYAGEGGEEVHGHFFGQSSFATHALARERNVVKIREDVPLEITGPLGCGIQTGAGGVLNSLRPEAGSSIAVFGTGTVGLAAVMAARVAGCATIIGVDIKQSRLDLARELGATHVINGENEDSVARIKEITGGGANYSIETTASPTVFRQSVDCLTQLGKCGLIGAAAVGTEAKVDISSMLLFGHRIQGIIEGDAIPDVFIPRLLELYVQGRFPFDKLVKFYDLQDINQAAEDSENGEVVKAILRMPA